MDKPTPASTLPDWQTHPDAWRLDREYEGIDSGTESAIDLIHKTAPTLFDAKASDEDRAEARRQIERATIRMSVYATINSRTGEVYNLKWTKERALDKEESERRVDEAVRVFLEEHEASGNEKYYMSHMWNVGEDRYRVTHQKILDRVLPRPHPSGKQVDQAYSTIVKACMVWDSHLAPDPQSPAFAHYQQQKPADETRSDNSGIVLTPTFRRGQ